MSEVSLLPAPRVSVEIERQLYELVEARVLEPGLRAGYELQLAGATVLPQRQQIVQTKYGKWMFVNHVADPTARRGAVDVIRRKRAKIPIPPAELDRLQALERAGVHVDLVWLGHQLPDTWEEGQMVPVTTPKHLREKDQRLKQRLMTGTELWLKAATATLAGAFALPAIGAAGLLAGVGTDPIVLGGIKHPDYPVVHWVLLAQWEWE